MPARNLGILRSYNGEILIKPVRDPLCGMTREEFLDKVRELLCNRVVEAWVFGSFATLTMHHYSDIDLIVVADTSFSFIERPTQFADLLDIGPDIDLLVYTPQEWRKLRGSPTAGFWNSVVRSMIRIM